jgi:hypothetical protein
VIHPLLRHTHTFDLVKPINGIVIHPLLRHTHTFDLVKPINGIAIHPLLRHTHTFDFVKPINGIAIHPLLRHTHTFDLVKPINEIAIHPLLIIESPTGNTYINKRLKNCTYLHPPKKSTYQYTNELQHKHGRSNSMLECSQLTDY